MLRIKEIRKEYKTGGRVQVALNDVSLALRDNEFVAILGPSGSGKTTLLNIIGGLDRYNAGDLIIKGMENMMQSAMVVLGNRIKTGMESAMSVP